MSHVDEIEARVAAALRAAPDDPRWAPPGWDDPVTRVRAAAGRSRRRHITLGGLGALTASVLLVAGFSAWSHDTSTVRVGPAGTGQGSGLDWLLTPQQWAAYTTAHPSPSPSRDVVASPAPVSVELHRLQAEVTSTLGDVQVLRADAANGGDAGHLLVWVRTGDGTPVVVERYRLGYPVEAGTSGASAPPGGAAGETYSEPEQLSTGSAMTALTGDRMGYSFGGGGDQWTGPIVWVVTPDGWFTSWTAPVSVGVLRGWAAAGDLQFSAGR
jgi:hypothetical protein